jgi:uncharacterized protein (TIGR02246 family)
MAIEMATDMATAEVIVASVLDRWKAAIEEHRPEEVAALFTDDAIFQGLRPYSVGRQGVTEYYAGQPLGLVPTYRILETRQPADGVVLGYVDVDFAFTDRPTVRVLLSVLLTRSGEDWLIAHYQVSPAPA